MKRSLVACCCLLTLSAPGLDAAPAPACVVTEEEPRCEAVAASAGNITYMVNGSARFAIWRNGARRKCVILGGHEAGNLWAGEVQPGDVLRIDFRAGYPSFGVAGGAVAIATAGFGDQNVC
jgi:hypothetical protein